MKKGVDLQYRDMELLYFLADYRTITLDNTKYIYRTKTYQEKRISRLVKENYLIRLKPKEIALGKKGKEYLQENGIPIKEHCRNSCNLERLKVISDIAACLKINSTLYFIPSWKIKDKYNITQSSRRFIGGMTSNMDMQFYTIYYLNKSKSDKYVTSLYYDLNKERTYYNHIIFVDEYERIISYKKEFLFSPDHLYLIPNEDFYKRMLRNYQKIVLLVTLYFRKKHTLERTKFIHMDYILDNDYYLKLMLFIDINQLNGIKIYLNQKPSLREQIYFVCLEENRKYIQQVLGGCMTITMDRKIIEEYLAQEYYEVEGLTFPCPSI